MSDEVGVELRAVRKTYGDTVALQSLDITARAGEITGIAGPNGAGKSTMIKLLAGEERADGGEILVGGEPWSPLIGARGVAVVHQEPELFPNLTVAENLAIGRERSRWLRRGMSEQDRRLLDDLAILPLADRQLGGLPLAVQQRTEIARALAQDARVFLFDEPNSALTEEESDDLFRRMHELADAGRTVLLVSHRLTELCEHTDRVSVLLDGRCSGTVSGADLVPETIARMLVAGFLESDRAVRSPVSGEEPTVLRLEGLGDGAGAFAGVDLEVRAGAIVAFAGVEGSGARELVRAIAGFGRTSGSLEVHRSGDARRDQAFVPASRADSLFTNMSVGQNSVIRLDREITGPGLALRRRRSREIARSLSKRFMVKAESIDAPIRSLSGGNQQKVAIAAAIAAQPAVLVLEEPTRGVDIGAKREIYELLRDYAGEGHAVVLYSTEIPEVFEAAHALHVVGGGRMAPPLLVADYPDVESLAAAATELERYAASPA
ncbi:MAG TPA: sugar ABC transporter ATP-binding protein [Conexibacter sp.]|jgi:ABC-type sugar transport system ATPase subunit